MSDETTRTGTTRPRALHRLALAVAASVAVVALTACTGERPTLESVGTSSSVTVLGNVIERSTTTTRRATTTSSSTSTTADDGEATTTTAATPPPTAPPPTIAPTTTTTKPTTTTTAQRPGRVDGQLRDYEAGQQVDVRLILDATGAQVASRTVTTAAGPVPFAFASVPSGRWYRIQLRSGGAVTVISARFLLDSGGSAFADCTPNECSLVL